MPLYNFKVTHEKLVLTDDHFLPEEGSVGHVVVHELPPLHHIVGVQLTRRVHVRHDVDTHLDNSQE